MIWYFKLEFVGQMRYAIVGAGYNPPTAPGCGMQII